MARSLFGEPQKKLRKLNRQLVPMTMRAVRDNKNVFEDMLTEDQMYEKGIDGRGRQLGEYSPRTIEIKQLKGQRVDHITLRDEGDFHESISLNVKIGAGIVIVDSEPEKFDPETGVTDLLDEYGEAILFLTPENQIEFNQQHVKPDLLKQARRLL